MPGPKPPAVPLSEEERQTLHTMIRAHKTPQHLSFRAQVILLLAEGNHLCLRTGCEFFGAQTLRAWAKVYGTSVIQRRCGQKNVWYVVVEHGMGMRLITMFFGPHAPEAQTARLSLFSHDFKR